MSSETLWRADRLITLREQNGWSQRELGRLSGISETMIAKYERGLNDPSVPALRRLSDVFGVSADYLLGATDDPRRFISDDPKLTEDERAVLEALRRDGWRGLVRLVADRMP